MKLNDWQSMALQMETRSEDAPRLRAQDEANKDRKFGSVSRSLCEPARPKATNAVIPRNVLVERIPEGRARGLEKPEMRARGERGTETRLPPMTRGDKVKVLAKVTASARLTPEQIRKARRLLGL
jgi:hypothetical protein